jgi:NAD(P)-dependent dehydrogenase (short-subunit alcohol dehydrogenase family)
MQIDFNGTVVLVTGASKGIGFACAQAFARAGARVAGIARNVESLAAASAALNDEGLAMSTFSADLIDAAAAADMVARVERELGPIGVLVNSAGAARRFGPDELGAEAFRQGMDAKYFSTMHVLDPVVRAMASRRSGAVVNVVGQGGRQANVMHIAGGSANAALMLATVGYARAYADQGIRVNAINPGLTRTGRVDEGLAATARTTGRSKDDILAAEVAKIPLGRMAEPAEIASVALFLASPMASYVTGAIIPMDGCVAAVI